LRSRFSFSVAFAASVLVLVAETAFPTDKAVERIEAILTASTERQVTTATLADCELRAVHYFPANYSEQMTPSMKASKVAKAVWKIDLTSAARVEVSPVRGVMHVGIWPAKKSLMSRILGLPTSVRQTKTMHHYNGDAYEQDEGIAVGMIIPKAADPELAQLLTDYIEGHCK